ncbi:MAG TPA: hypothetical protein VMV45_12205 [Casimicrobiaceae bacterium]|nr:hypothetical protein [Casimicrobiaceae bacterium]
MKKPQSSLGTAWWAKNLGEVDREIVRLATICNVKILEPGVIDRILKNDDSVCGSKNPIGFAKLRNVMMMHYQLRESAAGALGDAQTIRIVDEIVKRLKEGAGDRAGG